MPFTVLVEKNNLAPQSEKINRFAFESREKINLARPRNTSPPPLEVNWSVPN